jgi:hypothetical protein
MSIDADLTVGQPPTPFQIDYFDPDGNDWNLSDQTMSQGYVCSAIAGVEGIPVSLQTVPMLDGTAYPNLYIPQPGSIALAVLVDRPASDSENDYYNLLDALVRAFYNRRSELPKAGYLQIQRPDGTTRQVATYTTSGFDTPDVGLNDKTLYTFTLQTPDPYWYDATAQNIVYQQNVAQGILPFLPVNLASGAVLGATSIFNKGTATAYPLWTITGPGTPTFTNNTTGLAWSLNTSVPGGQVLQVQTKPGQQYATNLTTKVSVWDQLVLSTLRQLWGLIPGMNNITMQMAGASQATSVQLTYTNRWNRA